MPEMKSPLEAELDVSPHGREWLIKMMDSSTLFGQEDEEEKLVEAFISAIYEQEIDKSRRRLLLAAAFDLVVAAEYYRAVAHTNWLYCPAEAGPLLFYPYTNACPRCALRNEFAFHTAKKPQSGVIGTKTSRLLALFFKKLFEQTGKQIEVRSGREPVDIILIDRVTTPTTILFGEIKAAPLVTLPLVATSQKMISESEDQEEEVTVHKVTDNAQLYGTQLQLFVPEYNPANGTWGERLFPLGSKKDRRDTLWAYRGLIELFKSDAGFLSVYLDFWRSAHESYATKSQNGIYWLLNASGHPSPRPADWPQRRSGDGYESISDSKTSVGMDRTDDLKKATYQVLKIGAEGKPVLEFSYKVAVISNIHALRHFDEYLGSLKDIIWTRDETATARLAKDLHPETPLFNLFDGIIALTETLARDDWVRDAFDF